MRRSVLLLLLSAFLAAGCSTTRVINVTAAPLDSSIKIDGVDKGKGKLTEKLVFDDKNPTHSITVSRLGYKEQTATLRKDYAGDKLNIDLHHLSRRVTINVAPVAANVVVDGRALSAEPTDSATADLEF